MSVVLSATDATFADVVLKAERTVLVEFWAEWCPPCRLLSPILDQLAAEHPHDLTVVKVNADENQASAARYHALALPMMKVFRGGDDIATMVGARPKAAIEAALAPYLAG